MYKIGLQNHLFSLFYMVTLIDPWIVGHKNPGLRPIPLNTSQWKICFHWQK